MKRTITLALLLMAVFALITFGCKRGEPASLQENERASLLKGLNEYYTSIGYGAIEEKDLVDMTHITMDGEKKDNYRQIKFLPVFYRLSSLSLQNLKLSHIPLSELGNLESLSLGELIIENCDINNQQLGLLINKSNRIFRVVIFNAPNITDESLSVLLNLKDLDEIYIVDTGISQEGMGRLNSKFGDKLRESGHVVGE
ncbi:hypothetical protein HGB47_15410 [Leptospira yasudae]|uniref:hypothetical protein n=1 Tax=Leptospira yasudae TaxID=2202201 RepID=UPI001C4F8ADD|nr:hypothetical protein [Leptospira yasudae]MBW0435000.1 hypothetical protein [Leptospira yasudae]